MSKRCLVFDIDDTLYLERDYVRSGFEHVGRYAKTKLGIPNLAERAWELFLAGHRSKIFNEILQRDNFPGERSTLKHLISLYRSHSPVIRLLPDALSCLETLQEKVQLAVISDGPFEAQRNKVVALGLDRWFDPIFLTEELGVEYAKPGAASFCLIQKSLGFPANHCCYVADNPAKDFIAPRELGWKTIRIRRNGGLHEAADTNGEWAAEYELSDLSGLPTLLEEIWLSPGLASRRIALSTIGVK